MSGDPLSGFKRDVHEGLKVIETEGSPVAPCARMILEWSRESRCEEGSFLAVILPDRGLYVAASQCVTRFLLLVAILFPPLFEMKLALSGEEESQ
jgi:hypothetical protein